MFGFFSPDPDIIIAIKGNESLEGYRKFVLKSDLPTYASSDSVSGNYIITPPPGKTVAHQGVMLILSGEFRRPNGDVLSRFYTRRQELLPAGEIRSSLQADFTFDNLQFPTATYRGTDVDVVYVIQIVVKHRMIDFKSEKPFNLLIFDKKSDTLQPIHNEVGIRNVLHIEFVFPSSHCDCSQTLVGSVYFIIVKLRIVHMSLSLYRSESYTGEDTYFKKKTELKTFEIMDGAPVRGDNTPIRFFIGDAELWPFVDFHDSQLKVEHYVRATLKDEDGKSYFKKLKVEFVRYQPQ